MTSISRQLNEPTDLEEREASCPKVQQSPKAHPPRLIPKEMGKRGGGLPKSDPGEGDGG